MFRSLSAALPRLALVAALVFIASGCVSSRAFVPAEHVTAFSPGGDSYAAEYPLVEGGRARGELKVWSEGASRDRSDAEPRTVVRVSFELENHGDAPLRFDAEQLYIEELPDVKSPPGRSRAAHVRGELVVPPGERREIDADFTLPASVWPNDIPGYRVRWSVLGERRHTQSTPFLRAEPGYTDPWYPYASPYWGYYYPGFYGSWSFGYRVWPSWGGARYYPYRTPRYYRPRRR